MHDLWNNMKTEIDTTGEEMAYAGRRDVHLDPERLYQVSLHSGWPPCSRVVCSAEP